MRASISFTIKRKRLKEEDCGEGKLEAEVLGCRLHLETQTLKSDGKWNWES